MMMTMSPSASVVPTTTSSAPQTPELFHPVKANKERIDQLLEILKNSSDTERLLSTCESFIVEDEFFQWEGTPQIRRKREANKTYFMEKKGLETVMSLVRKASDELVKRFAVDVLWAYSETDENRRELLNAGALELIIDCLKQDNPKVQEGAVGALWQLLEYPPIQLEAVKAGLVSPLLDLLTSSKVTRTQTRAAGCLHLISWNEECRESLIRQSGMEKILSIETTALMVNYFRLLTIGNIMLLPEHEEIIDPATVATAKEQIKKFLTLETPENVRSIEDRLMYIWVSTKPYVPLIYSRHREIYLLGMFALANLTYKLENRKLLEAEELRDKVICATWCPLDEAKPYAETISKNFLLKSAGPDGKPVSSCSAPSLYATCYNFINNHHYRDGAQIEGITKQWKELFLR